MATKKKVEKPEDWHHPKLWPHQVAAIQAVEAFLGERRGRGGPSALVRMPTGTGKSGVIAVAAQSLVTNGDVLLLTPWDNLVTQLGDDVSRRFWRQIRATPPRTGDVVRLYPRNARTELTTASQGTIWLSTIATLQRLHATKSPAYEQLKSRLRLVVVDEGHYEPARSWSEAVRGLTRPTVLFSATPYRNDVKYFDLDRAYAHHYSHAAAERDRYLRSLEFRAVSFNSPRSFCDAIMPIVDEMLADHPEARVIVRCHSESSVRQMAAELQRRERSVVAIHERFGGNGTTLMRTVPDPEEVEATFWVHQFKLTEGIDSAAFRAVAFYTPFSGERAFVQQVGRVLRNPGQRRGQTALIIHSSNDCLDQSWQAYRTYDSDAAANGLFESPRDVAATQPKPQYFDGKFRDTFNIDKQVDRTDLLYSLSTRIFEVRKGFNLDALAQAVEDNLVDSDCFHGQLLAPDASVRIHLYIAIRGAPFLARASFFEYSLGYTIYRVIGRYLFFYNSHGIHPELLDDLKLVGADQLRRLFAGTTARLSALSLNNTDLGRHSVRRRTLHARSVADLAPDLSDHAQLATTTSGYIEVGQSDGSSRFVSRYIGFTRARISDRGLVDYGEYMKWLDSLALVINAESASYPAVFDRYAEVVGKPRDATPRNVLLDFDPGEFVDLESDSTERLTIDDLCLDISRGRFGLVANGVDYKVSIKWDGKRRRYTLTSDDLNRRFSTPDRIGAPAGQSLISYLNREQAFRVVPVGDGDDYCIYASRLFCRPRLPLGPRASSDNPDLLELIEGVPALNTIGSEKGGPGTATAAGWAAGTLFHLVDTLGKGTALAGELAGVDLLICDDQGTEIADFVALDAKARRVIAIHAKAFKTQRTISASALHDVSSQAIKNLVWFQPYVEGTPKNLNLWSGPWTDSRVGEVRRRVRKGRGSPEALWKRITDALRDPQTTREVWMLLGQGTPKSLLVRESVESPPRPELLQMLYSLQATWGAVSSVGARLRVFSSS